MKFSNKIRSLGRQLRSTTAVSKKEKDHFPRPVLPSRKHSVSKIQRRMTAGGTTTYPYMSRRDSYKLVPHWLKQAGIGSWLIIGILLVLSAFLYVVAQFQLVLIALFLSLVITSFLNPVVNWLARFIPRVLAVAIALIGSLAIVLGLITYVIASVAGRWTYLGNKFGNGVDMIIDFLRVTPFPVSVSQEQVYVWMREFTQSGLDYLSNNAGELTQEVLSNVSTVALGGTVLILALFMSIFFLLSGAQLWRWCLNQFPVRHRLKLHQAAAAGWFTFSGYARGTMIIASSDAVIVYIFLSILGVPLAAPLSVLVLIGAFIPIIGAPAAMLIAMVVALAANGIGQAIVVGIGIALIGQFEGHVLQPFIMGKQVSLHPLVVGVGVAAGTFLGGLLGAVMAIPIIAVIWAVYNELHEPAPPIEGELPTVKELSDI